MNTVDRDENGVNTELHQRLKERKAREIERAINCRGSQDIQASNKALTEQMALSRTPLAKFFKRIYEPFTLALFFFAFFCGEGFFQLLFNDTEFFLFNIAFLIAYVVMYNKPAELPAMASWIAEKATGVPHYITAPFGTMTALIVGFWAHTVFGAKNYPFTFALGAFTLFITPLIMGTVFKFVTRVPYKLAQNKHLFYQYSNRAISGFWGGYVIKIVAMDIVLGWKEGQMLYFLRQFAWMPLG